MRIINRTQLKQMNTIKQGRNWVTRSTWGEKETQTVHGRYISPPARRLVLGPDIQSRGGRVARFLRTGLCGTGSLQAGTMQSEQNEDAGDSTSQSLLIQIAGNREQAETHVDQRLDV